METVGATYVCLHSNDGAPDLPAGVRKHSKIYLSANNPDDFALVLDGHSGSEFKTNNHLISLQLSKKEGCIDYTIFPSSEKKTWCKDQDSIHIDP
ncbi:hypothetical protein [Sporisorium scitamineum]|nr:hypothetical protein [Sporisorium scitamineum]